MLSTFTTEHGLLVIRAEDLRRIEDQPVVKDFQLRDMEVVGTQCTLGWVEEGQMRYTPIQGTARENYDRLLTEEAKLLAEYEAAQRRQQQGLPIMPVPRGKAGPR